MIDTREIEMRLKEIWSAVLPENVPMRVHHRVVAHIEGIRKLIGVTSQDEAKESEAAATRDDSDRTA